MERFTKRTSFALGACLLVLTAFAKDPIAIDVPVVYTVTDLQTIPFLEPISYEVTTDPVIDYETPVDIKKITGTNSFQYVFSLNSLTDETKVCYEIPKEAMILENQDGDKSRFDMLPVDFGTTLDAIAWQAKELEKRGENTDELWKLYWKIIADEAEKEE